MSRYLEKDAVYKVRIPDDWEFETVGEPGNPFSEQDYRQFWKDKLVMIAMDGCVGIRYVHVYILKDDFTFWRDDMKPSQAGFERAWVGELVRHCPQVERYIESQAKENYTSPFDGTCK